MQDRPHIDFWIGSADAADRTEGRPPEERHTVPADVLAEVLSHAQHAIHLLAMASTGREIRRRVRIPADIRQQFQLVCHVPREGSYVQPLTLVARGDLFTPQLAEDVMNDFKKVGESLAGQDWDTLGRVVPDRNVRLRVAEAVRKMIPVDSNGWIVKLRAGQDELARFDVATSTAIQQYLREARRPYGPLIEPATLAGEVVRIDFAERKLTIRHHPTQRAIDCEYADDTEEMLLENRRDWVQVTGLVERDAQDRPLRLTDVFEITSLDLSPIQVDTFEGTRQQLRFRGGTRSFEPTLDESGTLMIVEDEKLGVHAYAESRERLREVLIEELDFLWQEYAEADPAALTPAAARLRGELLEMLELVTVTS